MNQPEYRKWYSTLTADKESGLLRHNKVTSDSLVICRQGEIYRGFSLFSPIHTFAREILRTPESDRCFYEVIFGDQPQKPYFDIDIDCGGVVKSTPAGPSAADGLLLVKAVKDSILTDSRIRETDILVFKSHGPGKLSYHIVVDNWCLPDVGSNKIYCHRILSRIPDSFHMKKYIDSLVYKSIQQFRTYGSTKYGKQRWKSLEDSEGVHGFIPSRFNYIVMLMRSLVSNTYGSKILEYNTPVKKVYSGEDCPLSKEDFSRIEALPDILDGTYEILEPKGRLVPLKRVKPSMCPLCNREHENENPYLVISPESDAIFFHCRRSNDKSQIIWRAEPGDPQTIGDPPQQDGEQSNEEPFNGSSKTSSKKLLSKLLGKR